MSNRKRGLIADVVANHNRPPPQKWRRLRQLYETASFRQRIGKHFEHAAATLETQNLFTPGDDIAEKLLDDLLEMRHGAHMHGNGRTFLLDQQSLLMEVLKGELDLFAYVFREALVGKHDPAVPFAPDLGPCTPTPASRNGARNLSTS